MLRSFRVENHKSIKDEQELSLLPAYDKSRPVVPVAAIFGANASGKSNLLDALRWLRDAVLTSFAAWQPGAGVPRTPFRLDPSAAAEPSGYSVEIELDGVRYAYGVIVDDERVREEWLYAYPRGRRRIVFDRTGDTIRIGSTVPDHRGRSEMLAGLTRPNALLLSVAAHANQTETRAAYDWFRTGLHLLSEPRQAPPATLLARLGGPETERARVVDLVRAADLGILGVEVLEEVSEQELQAAHEVLVSAQTHRRMIEARLMAQRVDGEGATGDERSQAALEQAIMTEQRASVTLRWMQSARDGSKRLVLRHSANGGLFELADESAGTRTWLSLFGAALDAFDTGAVLAIDELDMSLHPQLAPQLIGLFRDEEVNRRGAQLLFNTHDATLLARGTLARDEIWFVQKGAEDGATTLYPLTDFHPRQNENTEGRYLAGGYGAVPVLSATEFRQAVVGEGVDEAA